MYPVEWWILKVKAGTLVSTYQDHLNYFGSLHLLCAKYSWAGGRIPSEHTFFGVQLTVHTYLGMYRSKYYQYYLIPLVGTYIANIKILIPTSNVVNQ